MAEAEVLIVGAGATGSLLAAFLKDLGIRAAIVEKSGDVGGRLATLRAGESDACADLGAQYFVAPAAPSSGPLGPLYDSLLQAGVLQPFTGEVLGPAPAAAARLAAPRGVRALAEHLVAQAGAEVLYNTVLRSLDVDAHGRLQLVFESLGDGDTSQPVEPPPIPPVVVLTQPPPQVLGRSKFGVAGNFLEHTSAETRQSLSEVEYSSRFATVFFFDAKSCSWPFTWAAQYFDDGDAWLVVCDSLKRDTAKDAPLSVVVHSSEALGAELLEEPPPFEAAAARLLAALERRLPELPWAAATSRKVHKWRYSQVTRAVGARRPLDDWVYSEGEEVDFPGCLELVRTERQLCLLVGDALAPCSTLEGCVFSAKRAAALISSSLPGLTEATRPVPDGLPSR